MMNLRSFIRCLGFVLWFALSGIFAVAAERVDYNFQIRPLLSDRCYKCHGPDENSRKAKLRLDLRDNAYGKSKDGPARIIFPAHPDQSELIRRITSTDPDEKMPPPDSNLALSPDEIRLLERWVAEGAEYKPHWSLNPFEGVTVPSVRDRHWPVSPLDHFVLARIEKEGLRPSPQARKERLIRRVTFDLTGLPPAPADVDQFLADPSPHAYEAVVERLLNSPAYGERMAAEWLDVARFADTYGYQADRFNHLWPWRDWVIRAFNGNLPYDEFILWQIAGDLLRNATREQYLATAFNRNHRQTNEGGSVEEEFRVEYNADRLHTTAFAFLGLTMECARCHDHKYDPITQKDYYRMFAFFNSTDESGLYSHFTDSIPNPSLLLYRTEQEEQRHRQLRRDIASQEKALARHAAENEEQFVTWLTEGPEPGPVFGCIAQFTLDEIKTNTTPNSVNKESLGKLSESPQTVPGKFGQAFLFNGENSVTVEKIADFKRTDPFSFSLWLQVAEEKDELIVLHHAKAGSDAGSRGYELLLEHGRPSFALIHFWPGNAIKVRARAKLPLNEWVQLGVTYDGASRADGLQLYVNGARAEVDLIRDNLFKDITYGDNTPLMLAARFRSRGLKNGKIDELRIFNRALTALEMGEIAGGSSVGDAWKAARTNKETPFRSDLKAYYTATCDAVRSNKWVELAALRRAENDLINGVPEIMVMGDLPQPRATYVLKRGAYDAPGEQVTPGTPASLMPWNPAWPTNRLGLAYWLIDRRNSLTARVTVNRYWQLFFGRGLIVTSDNLGSQGALPSHPELLDWLASRFIESGWDLKGLCKLIVMSSTYRQASEVEPGLLTRDPDNILLARGPARRLTAEMLRDQALAASGLLAGRIGGPSVKPYQPEGLWEEKSGTKYEPDKGEGLYRRSLYTFWKRTSAHPAMVTFDAPSRETCIVKRQSTTTPLQALVLLNDPQFVEAARRLGERMLREGGNSTEQRLSFAFRLLATRAPREPEMALLTRLYDEQLDLFRAQPEAALALLKTGASTVDAQLDPIALAASSVVASALLSFDETLMKR